MGVFEAAWVIARRDFIATVYSRTFVIFLLMPVLMFGASYVAGQAGATADRQARQSVVAVVTDSQTAAALTQAREMLAANTSEFSFPTLRPIAPAEHPDVQARALLADESGGYSAVVLGTLDRPVLVGPEKIDDTVGLRTQLVLDQARTSAALSRAHVAVPRVAFERVMTEEAAGNLHSTRHFMARAFQLVIFVFTLLLATMMVTNLIEEKSNKVIEVLAAAIPLDSVFIGKLVATLGVSLLGLALWAGMIGLAYAFTQVLTDWVHLPIAPAIGWPIFIVLALIYFSTNFLLLGALFLSVGAQASSVKEIQTVSMPITIGQLMVLLLAQMAISGNGGFMPWVAYLFPFSSPMAMVAVAIQSETLWPHLLAIAWQLLWVLVLVRIATVLFRGTVMKSGGKVTLFPVLARKG